VSPSAMNFRGYQSTEIMPEEEEKIETEINFSKSDSVVSANEKSPT
jgi:hypothetical protein